MKIVVCYKNVPNADSIGVKSDRTLDFSSVTWEIGQYDLNAIEAAVTLAAEHEGSEVIAMTAAGEMAENSKQKKAVLSRGPDKMVGIRSEKLENTDAHAVAQALTEAIKQVGGVDLVVFGEGSGDAYAQQTGVLTGMLLNWNTVNAAQSISVEGGVLKIDRAADTAVEQLEVTLPAVVCVTGDINHPRIPTLKDIMAAGKKPQEIVELESLGLSGEACVQTVSILAPQQTERLQTVYAQADDDSLAAIAQVIRNAK